MTRAILAACLLFLSGLATGQQVDPPTINPGDFVRIFDDSSSRIFPLDFSAIVGATAQASDGPTTPLALDPAAFDEQRPLVDIEGDGVKLPDEQFSLP